MRELDQGGVKAATQAFTREAAVLWTEDKPLRFQVPTEAAIRAYLDATAPSRAPTREITMQDVRLIAGEGKLDAATVLDAVNAHLRQEAGRAVGGGVTRAQLIADLRKHVPHMPIVGVAPADVFGRAADFILARLAASHAGDRERWRPMSEAEKNDTPRLIYNGHWIGVGWWMEPYHGDEAREFDDPEWVDERTEHIEPRPTHWMPLPLAPAAGQDDAGEVERG